MATLFCKTDESGAVRTLVAHSPADAVKLRFAGWTEMTKPAPAKATPPPASAAEKTSTK